MSELVQQQMVHYSSHKRLLNLTGFFSSFAGAEPTAGAVAITIQLYGYGPDQGKSGASLPGVNSLLGNLQRSSPSALPCGKQRERDLSLLEIR